MIYLWLVRMTVNRFPKCTSADSNRQNKDVVQTATKTFSTSGQSRHHVSDGDDHAEGDLEVRHIDEHSVEGHFDEKKDEVF